MNDLASHEAAGEEAISRLGARGIDMVAMSYPDNSGIARVKAIPLGRLSQAVTAGVGMSPVFDTFLSDDSTITTPDAGGPVGDLRLHPDVRRLHGLPIEGWAWAPADRKSQDGSPHRQCHRAFARRMATTAAERDLNLSFGFEVEWVISQGTFGDFKPATTGPAYGMGRIIEVGDYLREVVHALAGAGLRIEQIHPEYSAGQFEVAFSPSDTLGAADDAMLAMEVIRAVSRRNDLTSSFSPAVTAGGVGNGRHVHVSVARRGQNLFAGGERPRGLTGEGESFLAGIIDSLPALSAVLAPSPVSFLRLIPQRWSGPFVCWGWENREAALRLITGRRAGDDPSPNVEVKIADASGSPYLATGTILAAGLAGMDRGLRLPQEITVDPATLGPNDNSAQGAGVSRLPATLDEALSALEDSSVLAEAMGPPLHRTFIAVRRAEMARALELTDEQRIAAYRFRI